VATAPPRIHFTGASGSGTSTLGRAVAARIGVPHFETDDYLWKPTEPPYQRMRPAGERVRLLQRDLAATGGWTLSGSLVGWGDALIPRFELVVLVIAPTELRLARLRERELRRFGAAALSPGGAMHDQHVEFLNWAAKYDDADESMRSLRLHERWLGDLPCRTATVDGTRPSTDLADEVLRLASG
jgi:adenylate kinase family enzyme